MISPVSRQARGRRRSTLILRAVKAVFAALPAALRVYPAEALVALCESVQVDEGDARCRPRGAAPGAKEGVCRPRAPALCKRRYCQGGVALVSQMSGI